MLTLNYFSILLNASNGAGSQPQGLKTYYKTWLGETPNTRSNEYHRYTLILGSLFPAVDNSNTNISYAGILDNISTEEELVQSVQYKTGGLTLPSTNYFKDYEPTIMVLGDGDTPPQKTDYKLDSFIGSDKLQCVSNTWVKNQTYDENTGDLYTRMWTFKNISNEPVTVKEIGLLTCTCNNSGYNTYSASTHHKVLVAREVLTSPVTIQPDEKYTFEFSLRCK